VASEEGMESAASMIETGTGWAGIAELATKGLRD
jgi:hypothetical protein